MSETGADWEDPFADDEAARERARRRAEREARRRARQGQTRKSLADRVREATGETSAVPAPKPAEPEAPSREPAPRPVAPVDLDVDFDFDTATHERAPTAAPPAPPVEPPAADPPRTTGGRRPPRPPRSRAQIRRRRLAALAGIAALIVLVAGAGAIISRGGDDPPPAPAAKERPTVSVTIPEGLSRKQIARVVKDAGLRGNYVKATNSTKGFNLKAFGAQNAESLEGFLFPATYEVYKGGNVKQLVRKQVQAFRDNFAGVNMRKAKRANLSPYDVVIIASMIEREISVADERRLAASVIYNRLSAGTPLGIDATVRYITDNWDEPLKESELATDSPYNTRVHAGLPPGPIGNPGLASLEAAANPADTDYFFYVVKPGTCGEHEFVETQAEFDAAVANYNNARDAAGGKSPTECE